MSTEYQFDPEVTGVSDAQARLVALGLDTSMCLFNEELYSQCTEQEAVNWILSAPAEEIVLWAEIIKRDAMAITSDEE